MLCSVQASLRKSDINKDLRGDGEGVASVKLGEERSRQRDSQCKGLGTEACPESCKSSRGHCDRSQVRTGEARR